MVFQKYIVDTAECMKILVMAAKGCGQLSSNDTYCYNSWFSGVKITEESMAAGVDYCGPLKTSHKGSCLDTVGKLMKYWPGWSYLVMKSTPIVPGGRPLMTIGYKYNSRNFLGFIATDEARSTEPGDPYLYLFPNIYYNVSVHPVVRLTY